MTFTSHSQAGQDIFVHELLPITNGTFLDIGCNDPVKINNTYALEQIGWTGLLVDSDINCVSECRKLRKVETLCCDAKDWNWLNAFLSFNYLSLDCNGATLDVLRAMPHTLVFGVITIETDAYRFGTGPRDEMRSILTGRGYDLVCADVCNDGMPFEDWYVVPFLSGKAERFRSSGKDWKEILGL